MEEQVEAEGGRLPPRDSAFALVFLISGICFYFLSFLSFFCFSPLRVFDLLLLGDAGEEAGHPTLTAGRRVAYRRMLGGDG